jgi:hypothetical protein
MGEEPTGGKVVVPTLNPFLLAYESYVLIFIIHIPAPRMTIFHG